MSLEDLRKKIDETDAKIVKLLGERMRIAEEIGREKKEQRRQVEDRGREEIVLENVRSIAQEEKISQEDIESIYRQIMTVSKSVQETRSFIKGSLKGRSPFKTSLPPSPCKERLCP